MVCFVEDHSRNISVKLSATALKNNIFIEANIINNSAKFQLYSPYSFWGVDFLNTFLQI